MNILKYIKSLNDFIAVRTTTVMGTMWCVYAFFIMVIVPFFVPSSRDLIGFLSSSVIQLISLPLIMVGSQILSEQSEKRAQEDHEMILAEFAELKAIHADIQEELILLRTIIASLKK